MVGGRRGIPASKVARDFAESFATFTESVHALLGDVIAGETTASSCDRGIETCASLWAAAFISMEASALRTEEVESLSPMVFEILHPFLRSQCGAKDCASTDLQQAAEKYLKARHTNQVTAAAFLVKTLLDQLEVSESARPQLHKRLSALFAHRMLGDIHRLNELRMHFGIQLTTLAGVISVLPMLHVCGLLRFIRLS